MKLFFINKREYECFLDCMVTYCAYIGVDYNYAFINSVNFDFTEKGNTIAERIKVKGLKSPRIQLTKCNDLKMDFYTGADKMSCLKNLHVGDIVFATTNTKACPWFPKSLRNRLGHDILFIKSDEDSFYMIDPFFGFVDENATLTKKDIISICTEIIKPTVINIPARSGEQVYIELKNHFTSYALVEENLMSRAQRLYEAFLYTDLEKDVFVEYLIVHEIPIIRKIKLLSDRWYQLAEFFEQISIDFNITDLGELITESRKLGDMWKKEYLFILVQYSDKKHRLTNEKIASKYRHIFELEYNFSKKIIEFAECKLADGKENE